MRSKVFCVILGVGLSILGAGCRTLRGPKADGSIHGVRHFTPGPQALVIDPRNGNVLTRWIGLRSLQSSGCPEVNGWRGEPLLSPALAELGRESSRSAREDFALIQELGLDRFCLYTCVNVNRLKAGPYQPFVAPPDLKASMDRLAISTAGEEELVSGSSLTTQSHAVDQALAKEFKSQAGQLPSPSGLLSGPANVRITVLDGEPAAHLVTGPPAAGVQHGFAVAHLARELVCKGVNGPCAATVLNQRVLNYGDPGKSTTPLPPGRRGSVGLVSDLATAITEAVQTPPRGKHLILNLSIGWDGEGDLAAVRDPAMMDVTATYVYAALQFAARKKVLVIAAAGNRRGGGVADSNWPILPAAWDLWPAGQPSHLIYAVGGVDWQGLPLPNSRTKGLPVRVAYGDHATVEFKPNGYTTAYTGSSVSTAVVSAAAAVIWNLLPRLEPAEVMSSIDLSGETQLAPADYHFGSPAPPIREISLCAAVKHACQSMPGCPAAAVALRCGPPRHQPPALSSLLTMDEPQPSFGNAFAPTVLFSKIILSPCHQSTVLLTAAGDPVAPPVCPTDQYGSLSAQPWLFPQPGDDPCPNCALVPTGPPAKFLSLAGSAAPANALAASQGSQFYQLAVSLSPSWIAAHPNSEMSTAMLDIDCFDTSGSMTGRSTYPVEITPIKGSTAPNSKGWTLFRLGDGHPLGLCRAQLNFFMKDGNGNEWSVQNPVVVDPNYSEANSLASNPDGSTQSLGATSTNAVTTGQQENKMAAQPPL
jgi:hypothetical protein